jgi:hypothetical protein
MKKVFITGFFILLIASTVTSQTLAVQADKYLQNFEGAGISAGLYMGHHYSMPTDAARDLAVQYIARDLNMRYLQDYIDRYPADDPAYFDRRANYIKAAKAYRPDIQVSQVGNKFPAALMTDIVVNGETKKALNTADPEIYNKVADWYFQLFKAFKERGVEVDILNVVNEPDYDKVYYYGSDGNTQRNVALIFERAVTKFLQMLNDPAINTLGMKIPKIMGPSTISPNGCVSYIQYFKLNYPQVWNMIDIVAYHQYINGVNAGSLAQVKAEAGSKPVFQSEMHTNRGDNLGTLPITDEVRGCISLGSLFGNALRTGTNCWFYFQTNYPNDYTPAGLLSIPWEAPAPIPYKHYYAFKQLSSAQPINSNVLEHIKASLPKVDIVCLRKKDTDTLYIHATNTDGLPINITISAAALLDRYVIEKFYVRTTNATLNDEVAAMQTFATPVTNFTTTLSAYSVNTITVAIKKDVALGVSNILDVNNQYIHLYAAGGMVRLQSAASDIRIQSVQVLNSSGQLITNITGLNVNGYNWYNSFAGTGVYYFKILTNKGVVVKKYMHMR